MVQICRVQAKNFGVYGAKKLHAQLRREGVMVARCTGQRLMPAEGLRGITREKAPRITLAGDGRTLALTWSNGTSPRPSRTSCRSRTPPAAAPSRAGSMPCSSSMCSPAVCSAGSCRRCCRADLARDGHRRARDRDR
ncbi:IS3 family transposase [Kocuria sp. SL71]|uniref:IS3 family transposase n=1 Tax=Kocuria sp. SL71 TaxID=2995151 RepID=UPI003FA36A6B